MKDISSLFDHFRVCARAVWNTAFWPDSDLRTWDSVDQFDEIQRILFSELVLGKIGRDWPAGNIFQTSIPFFRVVPINDVCPIMIQNPRSGKTIGYWDHPVNRIGPGEADLHFLAYFDWNRLDYVDFRHYRVIIAKFDGQPDLVGREALIDTQHASVFLADQ